MTRYPAADLAEALAEAERVTPEGAVLTLRRWEPGVWTASLMDGSGAYSEAPTPVEALQGLVARLEPSCPACGHGGHGDDVCAVLTAYMGRPGREAVCGCIE